MSKRAETTARDRIAAILMRKDAPATFNQTPLYFLMALLAIVFVSETLVMLLLPVLFSSAASKTVEALSDAGLLTLVVSPAVWLLLVRPLRADARWLSELNKELKEEMDTRLALEQKLTRQALHDSLTGLPNRAFFIRELKRTLARQKRRRENRFCVLFIDLNHFKPVNDRFGHAAGDQLLVAAARRLEGAVRPGDVVARLGGDEFTVLLDQVEHAEQAARVAQRILDQLRQPFCVGEPQAGGEVESRTVQISASIGIAGANVLYERAEELLHDADMAMYRAKSKDGGGFAIFDRSPQDLAAPELVTGNIR